MVDDPNKPSTIDDLVKQLSNKGGQSPPQPMQGSPFSRPAGGSINQPPPNLPGVKLGGTPPTLSPSAPSTSSGSSINFPKPPQPLPIPPQPKNPPSPQPAPILKTNWPAQEYKSSIRTMGEDISNIKSGQKPSGVDIPRQITPEFPKIEPKLMPSIPQSPTRPQVRVGLGGAEKSTLLPSVPMPKPPVPGGSSMPKPPVIQPPISVPPVKKGFFFSLSPRLYMLIGGIVVVAGFLYWFLIVRVSSPEVAVSPTPTLTSTPTPRAKNLNEIFTGAPANFEISLSGDIGQKFKAFVGTLNISRHELLRVDLMQEEVDTLVTKDFLGMFDSGLVNYPTGLKDVVSDSAVLVYGQSEAFNLDGSLNLNGQNLKEVALVARIKDRLTAESLMKEWELTIADDLKDYLMINDASKESSVNFLDNIYREVSIRYKNFPFPNMTVDYAIINVSGQNYLVISGSRESMYAIIDTFLDN